MSDQKKGTLTHTPEEPDLLTLTQCPACLGERLHRLPVPTQIIGESVFGPHLGGMGLSRCSNCALVFTNPRPSGALLTRFYQGANYEPHAVRLDSSQHLRRVSSYLLGRMRALGLPEGGRVLDYGCGAGFFVSAAGAAGFDSFGYEVGGRALAECAGQGLRVFSDTNSLPQGSFDAIIMHHVLEHLDGFESLFACLRGLLKPRGALFVVVPNAQSLRARLSLPTLSQRSITGERYMSYPIHLSHFNARSLRTLLERHGFHDIQAETFAFGITDLFVRPPKESLAPRPAPAAPSSPDGSASPLKKLIKWAFYGAGFGENLLLASRSTRV